MPKWISIEVKSPGEPDVPARLETGADAKAETSGSDATAWVAGITATLLVLVIAGLGWYFGIRPRMQTTAALPPTGVGVPAPYEDLPAVVATVNGEKITREQLTQIIRINQALYPLMNGSEVVLDPQTLQNLRTTLLEQMVNNRLELAAARKEGFAIAPADVEAEYGNFKAMYRVDDGQLQSSLARYNLKVTDIKEWLRDSLTINRFLMFKANEMAKSGQAFNRESWLNDQLVTADIELMLSGARTNAPLKMGEAPPDFTLRDIDGNAWKLSDLKGKAVIINFWATWCAPCRFEMPAFESLYKKYKDQGLVVLAVDIKADNGIEAVRKYQKELGMTFPLLMDTTGEVEQAYRVRAYPTTFFVGRDGKLREIKRGAFINAEQVMPSISKIMQ